MADRETHQGRGSGGGSFRPRWTWPPDRGRRHNVFCLDTSEALDGLNPATGSVTRATLAEA